MPFHETHVHTGWWHKITTPFSRLYHATVTPFYVSLGNQLGGRAEAGRLAHQARLLRLFGNALTLTTILIVAALVGFTAFWTGGAAAILPWWGLSLVGVGVGLNILGFIGGAAANHLKIEQYYDAEMELHAENEDLVDARQKLSGHRRKLLMKGIRTLHDLNGITGSVVSLMLTIPEVLLWCSVATVPFNPGLASTLFLVSRVLALVSAIGAWGTNQLRLWVYKKCLTDEITQYYATRATYDPSHHVCILKVIDNACKDLSIQQDHQYTPWVKFRAYKALEAAWISAPRDAQAISELLKGFLNALICSAKTGSGGAVFSREKLMHIQGPQLPKISVLDSMPFLECQLFDVLSAMLNDKEYAEINNSVNECVTTCLDPRQRASSLFAYHLKRTLLKQVNKQENKNSLISKISSSDLLIKKGEYCYINTEDKRIQIPTAHGAVFRPYYGTKKIVQKIFGSQEGTEIVSAEEGLFRNSLDVSR